MTLTQSPTSGSAAGATATRAEFPRHWSSNAPDRRSRRTPATALPNTVVAELNGIIVGFVVVVDDEGEQVYIDQVARGTGVAPQLLCAAGSAVAAAGHSTAWLAVVPGNDRARRFYAKHGWRDDGPIVYQADTADGPVDVPVHRYVRNLAAMGHRRN